MKLICCIIILSSFITVRAQTTLDQNALGFTGCAPDHFVGEVVPKINPNPLTFIWGDNFDGYEVNENLWKKKTGIRNLELPVSNNGAYPILEKDNLRVQNGNLIIDFKYEPQENISLDGNGGDWPNYFSNKNVDITTGEMWSRPYFRYGMYEIRCMIPDLFGANSAFWLWSKTIMDEFGHDANEIDVFEFLEDVNFSQLNVEQFDSGLFLWRPGGSDHCADKFPNDISSLHFDFSNDYHTFKLFWQEDFLLVMVDDHPVVFLERYDTIIELNPFNNTVEYDERELFPSRASNILVNVGMRSWNQYVSTFAVANGLSINSMFDLLYQNKLPREMIVDYIHYYGYMHCGDVLHYITNSQVLDEEPLFYNYVAAQDIILDTDIHVEANQYLHLKATKSIQLGPGFSTVPSANFKVEIVSNCNKSLQSNQIQSITDEEVNNSALAYMQAKLFESKAVTDLSNDILTNESLHETSTKFIATSSNEQEGDLFYEVYSVDGRLILTHQLQSSQEKMSRNIPLAKGIYIVKILNKKHELIGTNKILVTD